MTPELERALAPLRRRAYLDNALRWALVSLSCWAAATALVLAWSKLSPTGDTGVLAVVLGVCALLGGAGGWVLRRPSTSEVARVADSRLDLKERLASAVFFAEAPMRVEHTGMHYRLQADAAQRALEHRPGEAFPLQRHSRRAFAAFASVAVLAALAFTPNPEAATLARRSADHAAIAKARRTVASAKREVGHQHGSEAAQAQDALKRALAELQRARTPLQALVALSALESKLASLPNVSGQQEAAAAAAGAALAGAPGAGKLAQDLMSGNLKAAAEDLRKLAQEIKKLGSGQQKALGKALQKAAEQAGARGASPQAGPGANPGASGSSASSQATTSPFANELSQAAQALKSGKAGQAGKYLGSAASGATASARAASMQQELAAAEAAVRNAQSEVAAQAQADSSGHGTKATKGAGKQGSRRGHGRGASSHFATGSGRGKSARFGAVTGKGTGSGAGRGRGNGAGQSRGGRGAGSGNGSGTRAGAGRPSGQVFVGGQPAGSQQVIGRHLARGYKVKTTNYQQVLPSFEKTALQGLGSQVVSPTDQNLVRDYFSSLGGAHRGSPATKKG